LFLSTADVGAACLWGDSDRARPVRGPKLTRAFEPALLLAASGFHGTRTNRPAPACHRLVIHPVGVRGEIVAFPLDHLARRPSPPF